MWTRAATVLASFAVLLCDKEAVAASGTRLCWESLQQEAAIEPGQVKTTFIFRFSNPDESDNTITSARPSCGCTVVKLPPLPWKIPSGGTGNLEIEVNFPEKFGIFERNIEIVSKYGTDTLTVKVIPAGGLGAVRNRNISVAQENRQALFQGDCKTCHAIPAEGRFGAELYAAVCGICHDSKHRASFIPALREPGAGFRRLDTATVREVITRGRVGTLMPAFSSVEGGPLSVRQLESLVAYISGNSSAVEETDKSNAARKRK